MIYTDDFQADNFLVEDLGKSLFFVCEAEPMGWSGGADDVFRVLNLKEVTELSLWISEWLLKQLPTPSDSATPIHIIPDHNRPTI